MPEMAGLRKLILWKLLLIRVEEKYQIQYFRLRMNQEIQ